jgi:hypothetical protein
VVLSELTYVDAPTCNAADNTQTCTNINNWVFVQRQYVGNTSMATSAYGNPISIISDPTNGVTMDSQGNISIADYANKSGAVVKFASGIHINPFDSTTGTGTLPSRQRLYVAEAFSTGFGMPPFVQGSPTYSFTFF